MIAQTPTQLTGIASRIWPNFTRLDQRERRRRLIDLLGIAYATPFALTGSIWLLALTSTIVLERAWLQLLLLGALLFILDRRPFFWIDEPRTGRYDRYEGSLAPIVIVAALLLYGPSGLWITVASALLGLAWQLPRISAHSNRIREVRRQLMQFALLPAMLTAATVFSAVGGNYPFAQLIWIVALPAVIAISVLALGTTLIYFGYAMLTSRFGLSQLDRYEVRRLGVQLLLIIAPALFGMLMAAVFIQLDLAGLLFFAAGTIFATFAANQLSYANLINEQRTRELEQLEQFGRALIAAPPDGATLPNLLAAYVPFMFQHDQIDILLFPERQLLHTAVRPTQLDGTLWQWLAQSAQARVIRPNEVPPWSQSPTLTGLLVAPITNAAHLDPVGGIAITLPRTLNERASEIETMLPAVQTLAAQIGSALQSAEVYQRVRALDRLDEDVRVAATIQASFLPEQMPERPGWEFVARLRPARQTSGDFYDVFELANGNLALIIADVADKGTGPALFMAVTRTLMRTYAFENQAHPDGVVWAVNQRMLSDSHSGIFVTAFYGVLDTITGTLTYTNAGHNPPLLIANDGTQRLLRNTGIPLGIEEAASWQETTIQLQHGDTLLLYTDGLTEAQTSSGDFFELTRLQTTLAAHHSQPAQAQLTHLFDAIDSFTAEAERADDQTVLLVRRA